MYFIFNRECKEYILNTINILLMKFTLNGNTWNGNTPLPNEINVISYDPIISEFELLSIICALHGYVTAINILIGGKYRFRKGQ